MSTFTMSPSSSGRLSNELSALRYWGRYLGEHDIPVGDSVNHDIVDAGAARLWKAFIQERGRVCVVRDDERVD